jgi:hypothetical protein
MSRPPEIPLQRPLPDHTGRKVDGTGRLLDLVGLSASITCLVHCVGLPLLLALLPALTAVLQVPEEIHLAAFALAVPVSGWAMLRGYQLHGTTYPLLLGSIGLAALGMGTLGGFRWMIETGLTITGSLALAAAHLGNWRLRAAAGIRQTGH